MKINQLKILLNEFGKNVKFEHDIKKKIGLILEENLKFFIKLDNLKQLVKFLKN